MSEYLSNIALSMRFAATLLQDINDGEFKSQLAHSLNWTPETALETGTGANQANRVWYQGGNPSSSAASANPPWRSLALSTSEDLDLFDLAAFDIGQGAGQSALGNAINFTSIVAFLLFVRGDSLGEITLGGGAGATAWNSMFGGVDASLLGPFGPGSAALLFNPSATAWPVTDTSNHLLQIANSSGGTSYYGIALLGRQ